MVHWQKARNNARPAVTADLRWKAVLSFLYCAANNIVLLLQATSKSLDVCIFARFKVNCEFMPLRSFANLNLVMSSYRKELRRATKARGHRPWPIWSMRKSVTAYGEISKSMLLVGFWRKSKAILQHWSVRKTLTNHCAASSIHTKGSIKPKSSFNFKVQYTVLLRPFETKLEIWSTILMARQVTVKVIS